MQQNDGPKYGYGRQILQLTHFSKIEEQHQYFVQNQIPEENIFIDTNDSRSKRDRFSALRRQIAKDLENQERGTVYIFDYECLSQKLKTVANDIKKLHKNGITVVVGTTVYDFTDEGELRFQDLQRFGKFDSTIDAEKKHLKYPDRPPRGRKQVTIAVKRHICEDYFNPPKGEKRPIQSELATRYNISLRKVGAIIQKYKKEHSIH